MTLSTAPTLAIGFITYNPDARFYDRVALVLQAGLPVFVVDNSPAKTDVQRLRALNPSPSAPWLHYATSGKNAGLGIGLASLSATASAYGYEELLFFDQDTRFTRETLEFAQEFVGQRLPGLRSSHACVVFRGQDPRRTANQVHDVVLAISSGMLIVLENARRMGWHDHSYFVDGVDYEFCLKARMNGLKVAVLPGTPGFDHETEQPDVPRRFLGRTWRLRRYAPRRVWDSLSAYLRLTMRSTLHADAGAVVVVVRSALIFVLGQILARLPLRRAD